MRYEATVKHLLIAFSFTFYTFTTATICKDGEVGLAYITDCFSPQNTKSCDSYNNPWFGAILSNHCDIISTSIHESFCQGNWLSNLGTADCDATGVPNSVSTPDKDFNDCYQIDKNENYHCNPPTFTHPYTVELSYCCPPVKTQASR